MVRFKKALELCNIKEETHIYVMDAAHLAKTDENPRIRKEYYKYVRVADIRGEQGGLFYKLMESKVKRIGSYMQRPFIAVKCKSKKLANYLAE